MSLRVGPHLLHSFTGSDLGLPHSYISLVWCPKGSFGDNDCPHTGRETTRSYLFVNGWWLISDTYVNLKLEEDPSLLHWMWNKRFDGPCVLHESFMTNFLVCDTDHVGSISPGYPMCRKFHSGVFRFPLSPCKYVPKPPRLGLLLRSVGEDRVESAPSSECFTVSLDFDLGDQ